MEVDRRNWIGGTWGPSRTGQVYQNRSRRAPYRPLARWPRSGSADVEAAQVAALEGARAWGELSAADRVRLLRPLPERLEQRGPALASDLATCLGLSDEEQQTRLQSELLQLRETLEMVADGVAPVSGVGVFRAHWSDGVGLLAARLVQHLVAGEVALVFSDPLLPDAGHHLARALEALDLPRGVVSVLHDDGQTSLRAALGAEPRAHRPAWARLRGHPDELEDLQRHFGARVPRWRGWPLRTAWHRVGALADPAEEAAFVVERGLARSSTLSGQLPGHVGRVLCHQRLFSRFSEELLAHLEASPDPLNPVPLLEGDLLGFAQDAWALGLDEGATPVFGEEPLRSARSLEPKPDAGPDGGSGRGRGARAPRRVRPVVFTNVEAGQRFARLERPAPLLGLIRVPSDEVAGQLLAQWEARGRR